MGENQLFDLQYDVHISNQIASSSGHYKDTVDNLTYLSWDQIVKKIVGVGIMSIVLIIFELGSPPTS